MTADRPADVRQEIANFLRRRAERYPADVFPADSTTRDGIAGATLRDVLPRLADEIEREDFTNGD